MRALTLFDRLPADDLVPRLAMRADEPTLHRYSRRRSRAFKVDTRTMEDFYG